MKQEVEKRRLMGQNGAAEHNQIRLQRRGREASAMTRQGSRMKGKREGGERVEEL